MLLEPSSSNDLIRDAIERIHQEIMNEALKLRVVKVPIAQYKNNAFFAFSLE